MTKIKTVWEVIHFSWSTVWLTGVDLNTFWKKKKKKKKKKGSQIMRLTNTMLPDFYLSRSGWLFVYSA